MMHLWMLRIVYLKDAKRMASEFISKSILRKVQKSVGYGVSIDCLLFNFYFIDFALEPQVAHSCYYIHTRHIVLHARWLCFNEVL